MFSILPESASSRQRSSAAVVLSVAAHAALLTAAIAAPPDKSGAPPVRRDTFLIPLPDPSTRSTPMDPPATGALRSSAPADAAAHPSVPPLFAPAEIPVELPPIIDATEGGPVDWDALRRGVGAAAAGGSAGTGGDSSMMIATPRPALAVAGNPVPRYPDILRRAGIEGRVVARFVIGADGRPESHTLLIIESSHDLFALAVRETLPRMRFVPASHGGRPVRSLAEMPFHFRIE